MGDSVARTNLAPSRSAGRLMTSLVLTSGFLGACGSPSNSQGDSGSDADPADMETPVQDATADSTTPPNQAPEPRFILARERSLTVRVDASASDDPDGRIATYAWDFGDGQVGEGASTEHEYANAGCFQITLTIVDDRGTGAAVARTVRVVAAAPTDLGDFTLEGMPADGALLARDVASGTAWLTAHGAVPNVAFEEVVARVFRGTTLELELRAELCGERFSLELPIISERASRAVRVSLSALGTELEATTVQDVVAGDVYLINGQSNAVSSDPDASATENEDDFVRSFGLRTQDIALHQADATWHRATSDGAQGSVGQWPLRMAARLSRRFDIPIGLINGAQRSQPISYFARNDSDHDDLTTNYGRALDRATRAQVRSRVRALLFYQGESDGADATGHHDGFTTLHHAWSEDFPAVERFYATQIRQGYECGGDLDTREVQRRFSRELGRTSVMSTTGLDGHDGCHFLYERGYRELGDNYANLLARDLYGATAHDVEAVDVLAARLTETAIVITTTGDASRLWVDPGVEAFFEARGGTRQIQEIRAVGAELFLELGPGNDPVAVAFVGHRGAGPWITNAAGVGMLTFVLPL